MVDATENKDPLKALIRLVSMCEQVEPELNPYRRAAALLADAQGWGGDARYDRLGLNKATLQEILATVRSDLVTSVDWLASHLASQREWNTLLEPDLAQFLADLCLAITNGGRLLVINDHACAVSTRAVFAGCEVEQVCSPSSEFEASCHRIGGIEKWKLRLDGHLYDPKREYKALPLNRGGPPNTQSDGGRANMALAILPIVRQASNASEAKLLPYMIADDLQSFLELVGSEVHNLAVLVPSSFLYRTGKLADVRRELLLKEGLTAVIELPSGVTPRAGHPYCVLVLRRLGCPNSVRLVSLDREPLAYARGGRKKTEILSSTKLTDLILGPLPQTVSPGVREISRDKLSEVDTLSPQQLFSLPIVAAQPSGQMVQVRDLVEVVSPSSALRTPAAARLYLTAPQLVNALPDVRAAAVDPDALPSNATIRRGGFCLQASDLVVVNRGLIGGVGLYQSQEGSLDAVFVAETCIVLRAKEPGAAEWLYLYLKSAKGQEALKARITGSTLKQIRVADLLLLEVPLSPDLSTSMATLQNLRELTEVIDRLDSERQALLEFAVG
ncbi:N-6 DNA methylase [Cupriavidus basilensis]|uniref:N-6 DNA methylase n=1 Tax=Cupriavidus basilensis TaxID=68895 RepID=UPI0020A6A487|nr:N-6 DNA methylase [Cupriavidus basilensis]